MLYCLGPILLAWINFNTSMDTDKNHRVRYSVKPGGRLNIKMWSYQYRDPHVKDKTVSPTVLSLTWESPYLERRSLYWDGAQNPFIHRQGSNPDNGEFLPWRFLRGFWLNRIPNKCVFYFYPVISWIYIFMGNYSCFHIPFSLVFFTNDSRCVNVHLNCFFPRQPLCIQVTTTAISCDQLFNDIKMCPNRFWIFQERTISEEIKLNNSVNFGASYHHNLSILCSRDMIFCKNNFCKTDSKQFSVWRMGPLFKGFPILKTDW